MPATPEIPTLPVHRVFVVQFRAGAEVPHGRVAGRVEHVVSGQATHFRSSEEWLTFMASVLTAGCAEPGNSNSRKATQ
jgi:hypothetical protein